MLLDKPKRGALSALFEEAESVRAKQGVQSFESFVESLEPKIQPEGPGALAERFIVPPFSVLDAQQRYWQEKQARWIPVFDPLLCEIVYRWFAPITRGNILDPFGDATRAIVAGCVGYQYTGIEPSRTKIKAYERQASLVQPNYPDVLLPRWICCDPSSLDKHLPPDENYDLIFTNMPVYKPSEATSKCMERYKRIFGEAIARLKRNRCLVVVSRDVRGEDGFIQFGRAEVVGLLRSLGLAYYNRMELIMSGNLPEGIAQFWKGEEDHKAIPRELGTL